MRIVQWRRKHKHVFYFTFCLWCGHMGSLFLLLKKSDGSNSIYSFSFPGPQHRILFLILINLLRLIAARIEDRGPWLKKSKTGTHLLIRCDIVADFALMQNLFTLKSSTNGVVHQWKVSEHFLLF